MLLLVPVVLVGISALTFRSISRSKVSMRIAGAQLNSLQTRLCAEQCAAVAVNATNRTLEGNGHVTQRGESCECADHNPGKSMACATSYAAPQEGRETNCYGLEVARTDVDIGVSCREGESQSVTLNENVSFQEVPIFQFAVFFDQVLELYPGADMDITGRIHSNDTLRIFPSQNNLRMYDWVTSATVITGQFSKDGSPSWEAFPLMDGSGPDAPMAFSNPVHRPLHELIPSWDAWQKNHRVAYGYRAGGCGHVDRLDLPVKGLTNPRALIEWRDGYSDGDELRRQKYAWRANLIYKGGWLDNTLASVSLAKEPVGIAGPKVLKDAGGVRVAFWNSQEDITVRLLPIDVAALQQRPGDSIVYLYDSFIDAAQGGKDAGGFFLYNGKSLKRPLTIVSNSRLYNWGDFNVDSSYVLPGGIKSPYPASLVSDFFTQLSNEWDGALFAKAQAKGGPSIKSKKADAVTILNSCVMAGMTERNGSWTGQGGYQNLIHFTEDWGGVPFHYSGSTVCLWSSRTSTGAYSTAFYTPPVRPWNFDAMYKKMENMPPGTPRLVSPKLNTWEISRY
ncbi:MAG: hypothetical protein JWO30_1913 [Fibrobacteres bacterium]|nr:hypothetical protein [Fibrobacterota bacterium]